MPKLSDLWFEAVWVSRRSFPTRICAALSPLLVVSELGGWRGNGDSGLPRRSAIEGVTPR